MEHVTLGAGPIAVRRVGAIAREWMTQMRERRAHLGHPLAGDRTYASFAQRGEAERRPSRVAGDATGAARHMLHAAALGFEEISAASPDPTDFAELLSALR